MTPKPAARRPSGHRAARPIDAAPLTRLDPHRGKETPMRRAYHVLAYVIAVEVVIQAMMMATAVAGLDHWIEDGATVNKHVLDKHPSFTGAFGFPVHAINGEMLIPLIAIALLVISFFAKVVDGTKWALYILGIIIVQVVLGVSQGDGPL